MLWLLWYLCYALSACSSTLQSECIWCTESPFLYRWNKPPLRPVVYSHNTSNHPPYTCTHICKAVDFCKALKVTCTPFLSNLYIGLTHYQKLWIGVCSLPLCTCAILETSVTNVLPTMEMWSGCSACLCDGQTALPSHCSDEMPSPLVHVGHSDGVDSRSSRPNLAAVEFA